VKMMTRVACIAMAVLLCAGRSFPQPMTTLAVMDLNGAGMPVNDATALTGALESEIIAAGSFAVVARARRDQILEEWGFAQSGACGDSACLCEAGRYLRVRKVAGGGIDRLDQAWSVRIQLLDVGTGAVDMSFSRDIEGGMDAVRAYLGEVASAISRSAAPGGEDPAKLVRQAGDEQDRRQARLEFNVSGGVRMTRDKLSASRTTVAPGYTLEQFAASENRGGYCLETGIAWTGMGRFAPVCLAYYSFDRSKLRPASAPQYLRSSGLAVIPGMRCGADLSFTYLTVVAGAGYDWEAVEQQNPYFGGQRISAGGPVAAAGLSFDSPLFLGIWTTLGYTFPRKWCSPPDWSDQGVRYSFAPGRARHYVTFGLSIKP
jgi:hypothetical protein